MLDQRFPHPYDVWLCDEDPTPEVLEWCSSSAECKSPAARASRIPQPQWPRRTRCKEGNLAYFYDRSGYRDYDVVAQLDCDHVPAPTYLARDGPALRGPGDRLRGRAQRERFQRPGLMVGPGQAAPRSTFHGPVQLGHADGLAPSCIGSHYTVRTQALRTIGGHWSGAGGGLLHLIPRSRPLGGNPPSPTPRKHTVRARIPSPPWSHRSSSGPGAWSCCFYGHGAPPLAAAFLAAANPFPLRTVLLSAAVSSPP